MGEFCFHLAQNYILPIMKSLILLTKRTILYEIGKENLDSDKLPGSKRVKVTKLRIMQQQQQQQFYFTPRFSYTFFFSF